MFTELASTRGRDVEQVAVSYSLTDSQMEILIHWFYLYLPYSPFYPLPHLDRKLSQR